MLFIPLPKPYAVDPSILQVNDFHRFWPFCHSKTLSFWANWVDFEVHFSLILQTDNAFIPLSKTYVVIFDAVQRFSILQARFITVFRPVIKKAIFAKIGQF